MSSKAVLYYLVLLRKGHITQKNYALYFRKPADFVFQAGQYLQLTLPHQSDEKGTTRYFSIASAPEEKEVMIVTRQSESSFKNQLFALSPGDTVAAFGPLGTFVVKD